MIKQEAVMSKIKEEKKTDMADKENQDYNKSRQLADQIIDLNIDEKILARSTTTNGNLKLIYYYIFT